MARDLMPEGDGIRKAVQWISDRRKDDPQVRVGKLIDEASQRFDLSPLEADFLWRTLSAPSPEATERS